MHPKSLAHWKGFLPPHAIVMARSGSKPTHSATPAQDSWEQIHADLQNCTRCKLSQFRKTIVIGEGNPLASLVFVGETPGEAEDRQGRPFIGDAGQLLNRMISAITLRREDVYFCNVIKCRPPGDRDPESIEITTCSPFLKRQLALLNPRVIVALGQVAAQALLGTDQEMKQLRGTFQDYPGARLMPTFHPAHLLLHPEAKKEVWSDLKQVAQALGLQLPEKKT